MYVNDGFLISFIDGVSMVAVVIDAKCLILTVLNAVDDRDEIGGGPDLSKTCGHALAPGDAAKEQFGAFNRRIFRGDVVISPSDRDRFVARGRVWVW